MTRVLGPQRQRISIYLDWLWGVFLSVTACAVFVPFWPNLPETGLDPSWAIAMDTAAGSRMVFGRDIIFTFGPYASVFTRLSYPPTYLLTCFAAMCLSLSWSVAILTTFRHSSWWLRVVAILIIAGLINSTDALLFSYPMAVTFAVYSTICDREGDGTSLKRFAVLLGVMFIPFGLMPLIKGSMLIACVAIAVNCALMLSIAGYARLVPIIFIAGGAATPIFWLCSGQALPNLPGYFSSMIPIIDGYSSAMSISGDPVQLQAYIGSMTVIVLLAYYSGRGRPLVAFLFAAAIAGMALLVFKAAFVRHDGHAIIGGGFIVFVGLMVATRFRGVAGALPLTLAAFSWSVVDIAYVHSTPTSIILRVANKFQEAGQGVSDLIMATEKRKEMYDERMSQLRNEANIPTLAGTTDIYSYDQWALLVSGNAWSPRPILQSYSAYTSSLADLNREHLLNQTRPDNILFSLQTIDARFPSLDDGPSWPTIITNYAPIGRTSSRLILRRKFEHTATPASMTAISQATYGFETEIPIPEFEGAIYLTLDIRPTNLGRLQNTLFKSPQIEIIAKLVDGDERHYRIVPEMARSGFVISPLIETTEDFLMLYGYSSFLDQQRVKSFSLRSIGGRISWNHQVVVTFQGLHLPDDAKLAPPAGVSQPFQLTGSSRTIDGVECSGWIDAINHLDPRREKLSSDAPFSAKGWFAISTEEGVVPEEALIALTDRQGRRSFLATKRTLRSDVATHFKQPQLIQSGFDVRADLRELEGEYDLRMAYRLAGQVFICGGAGFNLNVKSKK